MAAQFLLISAQASAQTKTESTGESKNPPVKLEAIKVFQHSKMAGDGTIYVCSSGIRVESQKGALITVSRPPDWKVYRFNPRTKSIIAIDRKLFVNRFLTTQSLTGSTVLDQATVKKTGSRKQFQITVDTYASDAAYELLTQELHSKRHVINGSYPKTFEMTVLPAFPSSAPESHVLSVLYGTPNISCIVLDLTCHGYDGKTYKFVRTNDLITVPATSSMFDPPVGYKTVKDQSALVVDSNSTKDLLDLMR